MALMVSVCGLFAQELVSLDAQVKAAGLSPVIDGGTSGVQYNSNTLSPAKAFDGKTYSTVDNDRWVGSIQNGTWLRYALPDGFSPSFTVFSYRLHSLSTGAAANDRAPRSWALYAHEDAAAAADADGWVLIDERSDVEWPFETGDYDSSVTGSQYIMEFTVTLPGNYRAYKFVPLSSKIDLVLGETWSVGLMELVFLGTELSQGSVLVTGAPSTYGTVSPDYGLATVSADSATTFVASEYGYTTDTRYRCAGYTVESLNSDGTWTLDETVQDARSYTYADNGSARRLTWLWEEDGYLLMVAPEGSGSETFTYSPEPEADKYYSKGTQVTVTAHGAADPASTFRSWSGDVPEGAAGSTVTVIMDAPKNIVANFTRSWKYVAKTGDMPFDAITDGNWFIYITENGDGYRTTLVNDVSKTAAASGSGVLDISTLYADTAAQGTPIHLNYFCYNAFKGNTGVTGLILGEQSIEFGQSAFANSGLTFVEMPDEAEVDLGFDFVFSGCRSLKTVKLSNRITALGGQLFGNCTALETVTPIIPQDTVRIGSPYYNCISLKGTPDVRNLQSITGGSGAFYNCAGITGNLDFQSLTTFTDCAPGHFENTGITSVRLPVATEVAYRAFMGCTSLTNVVLSNTVTTIGSSAFNGCTALKTVEPWLPDTVTTLSQYAFRDCSALETAPVLNGVTGIGQDCFYGASSMSGVVVVPALTSLANANVFRASGIQGISAPLLEDIPQSTFNECTALEWVELPSLRTIGPYAFNNCTSLSNFVGGIPVKLETIGNYAFQTCTSLAAMERIRFPKTLTSIGTHTFRQSVFNEMDFSLTQVESIPTSCFSMASFQSVILPTTLNTIGTTAFYGQEQFSRIYFCGAPPASVTSSWNDDSKYELRVYVPIAPTYGWTEVIDPDVESYSSRANYATVVEEPDLIGVWSEAWVYKWTPPNAQTLITTIILQ